MNKGARGGAKHRGWGKKNQFGDKHIVGDLGMTVGHFEDPFALCGGVGPLCPFFYVL